MTAEETQIAADIIRDAIAGKPPRGNVEVRAGDVLAVAKAVPQEKHTELSGAAYLGGANNPADAAVFMEVRALAALLSAFDATRPTPGE